MEIVKKYQSHQQKCELLLQDPEIRFAGLLDPMGNLVAGGFRTGVEPLKDENEKQTKCDTLREEFERVILEEEKKIEGIPNNEN